MKFRFVVLLWSVCAVTVAACSTEAPMAPVELNEPAVAALIVKPKVVSTSSTVTHDIRSALGKDAGVRYVRPMAGDAHVVYLTSPAQREQIPALIERLRVSGAFQYVELDSMMKIQ